MDRRKGSACYQSLLVAKIKTCSRVITLRVDKHASCFHNGITKCCNQTGKTPSVACPTCRFQHEVGKGVGPQAMMCTRACVGPLIDSTSLDQRSLDEHMAWCSNMLKHQVQCYGINGSFELLGV